MGVNTEMYGEDILEHPLMYRGVVEDVDDPEKAGRIRVRVMGIHSDNKAYVETFHLPWAIPATSLGMSGGGLRNIGVMNVPSIGSHVYVFFEAGDHNFPVFFAAAPAIEDVEDYQEKNGKRKDGDKGVDYEFDKSSQYDDKSGYSQKILKYETKKDEEIEHPVQDWGASTRKNIFGEGGESEIPPPTKDKDDPQPIFPEDFFLSQIRIAFDGAANHDTPGYNGIHCSKPSNRLTEEEQQQELDLWDEHKWGHNDDDNEHQYKFKVDGKDEENRGGTDWKPEYPMVNTERNPQGEIVDTDTLKERRVFIHPSKYFIELVQLDSSRKKEDFNNERSIKKIYERQRGIANTPDIEWSNPKQVKFDGESNQAKPIDSTDSELQRRVENEITYDDIEGEERQQRLSRFEERKHNPGREKTVVEDFVYRYYMNKVNETYKVDRNTRFYTGNDNEEIEHGDRNYRLHRGSHNQHIDEGNYNRVVNKGWEHLHIDAGHQFIEICGTGSGEADSAFNSFEVSENHEEVGNPDHCDNQHGCTDARSNHPKTAPTLASNLGCDAKFASWTWEGENDCGNQFFLLHEGSQIFRLVEGHQHFHLLKGHQKFHLVDGHQTFHLQDGDQRWQLDSGDMERYANGHRYSIYTNSCVEDTYKFWRLQAVEWYKIKAPTINLDGDVLITGRLNVEKDVLFEANHETRGTTLIHGDTVIGSQLAVVTGIETPAVDSLNPNETTVEIDIKPLATDINSNADACSKVALYSALNPLVPGSCSEVGCS